MKQKLWAAVLVFALCSPAFVRADDSQVEDVPAQDVQAQDEPVASSAATRDDVSPMVEVIDIPTADALDAMTYSTAFRFYSDGGLASRLVIGPLKRVNLGITFDAQRVIGAGDPHMVR